MGVNTMRHKTNPESFIRKPAYPGGQKALNEFVRSNLRYPEDALKRKIEGSVKVSYDINVFGEVSNVAVQGGIGYGCDEEAVRIVKLLQYEKKKYRGLRVGFHNSIWIHFHLPGKVVTPNEQHQAPKPLNFQYHYVESKAAKK